MPRGKSVLGVGHRFSSLLFFTLILLCHGLLTTQVVGKELEGFGDDAEDVPEEEEEPIFSVSSPKKAERPHASSDEEVWEEPTLRGTNQEVEDYSGQITEDSDEIDEGSADDEDSNIFAAAGADLSTGGKEATVIEEWDEEEFEGIPVSYPEVTASSQTKAQTSFKPKTGRPANPQPRKPFRAQDFVAEGVFIAFLVVYAANYFLGGGKNEKLALSWAEKFATEGGIFHKNFSLLGTGASNDEGEPLMIKEGQGTFRFYASGRRFCECALVTLSMRNRHDLLSLLWNILFPHKDTVTVDIHMNQDAMEPFILAVARRRHAKSFLKNHIDLKEFCSMVDFSARRRWPDELAVMTDCREAANEILNDNLIEQLLQDKAPRLVYLHFTDQETASTKKKVLHFQFELPPAERMDEIGRLMASVPYFIDTVGKLTISAAAKAKAEEVRARAQQAALKEQHEQRMEDLQRRREERRKVEEAKLSPAELARRKEKERQKDMKTRTKLTRIH